MAMPIFEVRRNGRRVARAGVSDGVTSVLFSAVVPNDETVACRAGGLDSARRKFVVWWRARGLRVGDRVAVRVKDVETPDPPRSEEPSDPPRPPSVEGLRRELAELEAALAKLEQAPRDSEPRHGRLRARDLGADVLCLVVRVNDEAELVAGIAEGVLTASVVRVDDDIFLQVGGLDMGVVPERFLDWVHRDLRSGDLVRVEVARRSRVSACGYRADSVKWKIRGYKSKIRALRRRLAKAEPS